MADLGKQLLTSVLEDPGTLKALVEHRFDREWMTDQWDLSRTAIFSDDTAKDAYLFVLKHWEEHRKVPSRTFFEASFPRDALKLPPISLDAYELLELAGRERRRVQLEVAVSDLIDKCEAGDHEEAGRIMAETVRKIRQQENGSGFTRLTLGEDFDLDEMLDRPIRWGIPFGHEKIDNYSYSAFAGFQPGWLVAYLGRPKAHKTGWLIRSAISAAARGKRVLFFSVEISKEGIANRMISFHAEQKPIRIFGGNKFSDIQREKLHDANESLENVTILQPRGKFTVDSLEDALDKYEPDVVYIDGFYFMTDRRTGETAADHKGQDNLANDLKSLAEDRGIAVVLSHQAREKQITGKRGGGFDSSTAMGGTALTMYVDLLFTLDKAEDGTNYVRNYTGREIDLPTIKGTWNWDYSRFDDAPDDDVESTEDEEGEMF